MKLPSISRIVVFAAALATSGNSVAQDESGLITRTSGHDVAKTIDNLETVLRSKGFTIFARVDHSAGATSAGLELRPTQLLIFGNPKAGTPLMKCSQSIAIDLPQKMLAWEAEDGKVYLGYNDPSYLKERHNTEGCDEVIAKVSGALSNFAKAATSM